jgi:hypothetical protein
MSGFWIFVLFGLALAAPAEVLNQVLARGNPPAFLNTMISYFVLLVIGYFVNQALARHFHRRARARLTLYLLFGSLGLMVEWFLLGNAPVLSPLQLITQSGMFTYWGTMMLAPCLLREPADFAGIKRKFVRFFGAYSLLYLLVAGIVPRAKGGIFFAFVIFAAGTAGLNVFYVKYFRFLSAAAAEPPAAGANPGVPSSVMGERR